MILIFQCYLDFSSTILLYSLLSILFRFSLGFSLVLLPIRELNSLPVNGFLSSKSVTNVFVII